MTERHSTTGAAWAVDPTLLARVRKTSIVLGAVLSAPIATYFGWQPACAWLLGVVWSVVNLAATQALVRRVLTLETRNKAEIVRTLALKFGLLYGSAALLLAVVRVPALWWATGVTWPLFVAVMKAAGRSYLRLDELDAPLSRRTP